MFVGDSWVKCVLRGHVMVCEEEGSGLYGSIQPSCSDNVWHDWYPSLARAAASWKVISRMYLATYSNYAIFFYKNHLTLQLNLTWFFLLFSVVGSVLVMIGLYILLWGKSKDMMQNSATKFLQGVEEAKEQEPQV